METTPFSTSEPPPESGVFARAVLLALTTSIQHGRDAFTTIGHGSDALDRAVHAVRKSNKNAAAALWLLEPWVEPDAWNRAATALRRASRLLREPRRAVALTETLRMLASDDAATPEAIEQRLAAERIVSEELLTEVASLLDRALAAVREFAPLEASDDAVLGRVDRASRRLRQKTRAARNERSNKRLHSLRKALKRHAAVHQALAPLLTGTPDAKRLDDLAAHLGKLNDLEDLKKQVRKVRGDVPKRQLKTLKQRVQKRRAKELRVSQKLARKISRKPGAVRPDVAEVPFESPETNERVASASEGVNGTAQALAAYPSE